MTRVYMSGVFDMFHRGHLESIKKCLEFGDEVIIGVVSDKDTQSYKRLPVINERDRVEIIKSLKYVSEVIFPAPMYTTLKFIRENKIDLEVHGFSNDEEYEFQKKYFEGPIELGIFKKINYFEGISTTEIIKKIVNRKYSI